MVFVDGIKKVDDLYAYARDLKDLPKLYNGDLLSTQEVEKLGYKLMICGRTIWLVYKAVKEAYEELRDTGQVNAERAVDRSEVLNLLGLQDTYELERKYGVPGVPVG